MLKLNALAEAVRFGAERPARGRGIRRPRPSKASPSKGSPDRGNLIPKGGAKVGPRLSRAPIASPHYLEKEGRQGRIGNTKIPPEGRQHDLLDTL